MPLNDIALSIYALLQPLVTDPQATITYSRLVDEVNDNCNVIPPLRAFSDKRLYDALGDIANACKAKGLPPLTAIVVLEDVMTPSAGYYKMQYPHLKDEFQKLEAWINDLKMVRVTEFPPTL